MNIPKSFPCLGHHTTSEEAEEVRTSFTDVHVFIPLFHVHVCIRSYRSSVKNQVCCAAITFVVPFYICNYSTCMYAHVGVAAESLASRSSHAGKQRPCGLVVKVPV